MAINKNLIHFNKKEDFEREVANDNILDRSIVFIKDSNEIHTHGTTYGGVTPKDVSDLKDLIDTHHKEIQIYCIEPVTVTVDGVDHLCEANKYSTIFVGDLEFTITPTSNKSIKLLSSYPIPLTWYDWLEGVEVFSNIIFDMNAVETYHHWSQGNQGQFHVQFAQYINCIFWSDNSYVSAVNERTNYTIYNSAELPLCYSTIRENTYKAFYFAYGVKTDPNWNNDDYLYSFSLANWATQTWSYYGARTIGIFNSSIKPITLPKDCRGLCFYSPAIENVGVLDAINTTNFGAKKGSWSEAFGYCFSLKNLYIRNLKVSINISWSPINLESITYIINNAANTSAITISVSPYTWNIIPDSLRTTASSKNITIALISTNYTSDDLRWNKVIQKTDVINTTGDGNSYLANDGTYKTIAIPSLDGYVTNDQLDTKVNESIANLVDNAPETLDTLGELATAFKDNSDVVDVLNSAIGNKSDVGHTHDERYYTKAEVDELLSNYVSLEVVQQMIADAIANLNNPETLKHQQSLKTLNHLQKTQVQ